MSDLAGAQLTLQTGYDLASPPMNAAGVFAIDRGGAVLLAGSTGAIHETGGVLVIELDGLTGLEAASFVPGTVARISFEKDLGNDLFAALSDTDPYDVSVQIGRLSDDDAVSPVPVPAALPLLASALIGAGLWRRRARR